MPSTSSWPDSGPPRATFARLTTASTVLQGSIWDTVSTGCSPGKHGRYYMLQMRPGHNAVARIRADHCFRVPFWSYLPEGDRVCIVDVPMKAPSPRMNGLQIVEWGAYDHAWEFATSPPEEAGRILSEYGKHPMMPRHKPPTGRGSYRRLLRAFVRGVRMKHRLNMGLLDRESWRFFMSVFGEAHPTGHYYWRHFDESHPRHDPRLAQEFGTALRQVYAEMDRAVGEVVNRWAGERNVLIVSGHGMGPEYQPHHLLPEVLVRMGVTVRPDPSRAGPRRTQPMSFKRALLSRARKAVPPGIRKLINRFMPVPRSVRDEMMIQNAMAGIDFERSRAFCLPTDLQGFIRVNLKGREPDGVVAPGPEYDAVCDEVERELLTLRCAETDRPVVKRVIRTHREYSGADHLEHLPDLCVLWHDDEPIPAIDYPGHGTVTGTPKDIGRSGNHRPRGFLLGVGPGIRAGVRTEGDILDIAPTVFALLGAEAPPDWDGRVLSDILS
jgi:predicted AlkP superfamily phosphohydrolase/phosphomutase